MSAEQQQTGTGAELVTFNFAGQEIRVAGTKENPLFCTADICAVLELNAYDATRNHPEEEKGTETFRTLGGDQKLLCVTEPGLYRLIFRSYKPAAEDFRRWVFAEVLPALRHTGQYAMPGRSGEALDMEGRVTTFMRVTECLVRLGSRPVAAGNAALRWLPVITAGLLLPSCEEKAREETEELFTAVIERSETVLIMVKLPELIVIANELGLLQEHVKGSERSVRTRMGMCLRHMRGAVLETARGQWEVRQRGTTGRSEWILRRVREGTA